MEPFHTIHSKKHIYQLNSYDEDQKIISDILKQISEQINVRLINESEQSNIRKMLGKFDSFKEYPMVALFNAYSIAHSCPFQLLVLTTNSVVDRIVHRNQINRETIVEHEFVGFVRLQKHYPHTYIRPETIADKVNELWNPLEVDFEINKKFSRKYYTLTTNEELFRKQTSSEFLNAMANYDGLEVEIIGQLLIVRTRNRISKESAFKIINFLGRISNGEN